jgi:hypothetical protein
LSLRAAVIIVVKKRLVNGITFILFCRQWKRGGGTAVAEVAAVAARRWWRAWGQRRQLGRSVILVVAAGHLEVRRQHGSGSGNSAALAAAAWCMLTIIAMVTIMTMIDY